MDLVTKKKTTTKKKAKSTRSKTTSAKKTATKRPATKKKTTKKVTAGTRVKTAAKATKSKAVSKKKTSKRATAKAAVKTKKLPATKPITRVEEDDGAIVIRFAPVAPSPFAAPERPTEPEPAPPVEDKPQRRPRPEPEPKPKREPRREPEVAVEPEPKRTKRPAKTESDEGPSRAKRRRQRRKRSKSDDETVKAPKVRPEPPAEEPVVANGVDEAEEDRVAWIDDEDVMEAEVIETEPVEPEIVEPDSLEVEEDEEAEEDPLLTSREPATEKRGRRRRRGRRTNRHETTAEAPRQVRTDDKPQGKASEKGVETPTREMVINTVQREECRIAILENGRLQEIYLERAAAENHVGNIYKGVVTNVESSIQAAFVDFGQGKNGFLHISDLHPEHFPDGAGQTENVGRKLPRRSRPPIQRCLRRGQELLVQVIKEGIGTKGPTLSTYLSIPGRFLVMMPGMRRLGVSRRIEDDEARDKLRKTLGELDLPDGMGFIARTAALDHTKRELQSDLAYLTRLWRAVEKRIEKDSAPAELYRESDLVIRTIRDVFTSDIERIVVDDEEVMQRAREFLSIFSPRSQDIVTAYTNPMPIFHKYDIEAELERLHSRHVPLKSGGSLVIDQTEALVAIDVNSGRFRAEDDAETTAYKINLEAADEIPRQLRLRDLGGVVVCDFIDMRAERHRRTIEQRMIKNLKAHKERAKVLRTSAFGLIELTRQRQRASLTRSVYRDCRHCHGTGLVKTVESVTLDVMRLLQLAMTREHIQAIEVAVSPEVALLLQNRKRKLICDLEERHRRTISIRLDPTFSSDQVDISYTDARGRVVPNA